MASAGVATRDSQLVRPSLQPNGVLEQSHQTVASSFSDIGIVLPSVHLGSFSAMTFDTLPRTASTSRASSPEKRQQGSKSSDVRSLGSQSGVRQVTENNNSRPAQILKQGAGELSSNNKRLSSASRSSRVSSSRMFDQTNRSSSMTAPAESIERAQTPSTIAGGSYARMLPTPIPSTASSSQPTTTRTPVRESPNSQQPLQPRQPAPGPLPRTSLSSAEEEDEQNGSFNVSAPLSTSPRSVNDQADRERVDIESGTPQLKIVNGQHSMPRRVESVDYASTPPFENNTSWVPSPSSSPYPNAPSASRHSSPPPPRGAALPDPSSSMFAAQALSYLDPTSPVSQSQNPSVLASSSSPQPLSQQRPLRSLPPAALSQSQPSSQAGPRQSYTFPPIYNVPGTPAALQSSPQAQYTPRQQQLPTPAQSQLSPIPVSVAQAQTAQKVIPPEEVCIECMMRDRDMADVDATSPGVWERESDVWYEELVRREMEEARRGIVPSADSNKPKSKGDPLTEEHLAVWLTMNPKEPAARWQTLEKYVKAQAELLAAENDARETTLREARTQDTRIRDTFQHVRCSTGADTSTRISLGGDSSQRGIKLRASTAYEEVDPYGNLIYGGHALGGVYPSSSPPKRQSRSRERDVTLLESGLIMERVDIQKEEKEERARQKAEEKEERRRTRKISRVSASGFGSPLSDASSMHSVSAPIQGVNYGGSRSQISLTAGGSVNGASGALASSAKRMSSPLTLIPRPTFPRGTSQSSTESRGTPRFFNFKHWNGAFGSEVSLHHNSGSMMDMHLGLEQDREMLNGAYEEQNWTISRLVDEPDYPPEETVGKDKRGSIGRLWKMMTGGKDKDAKRAQKKQMQEVEDLNVPLDPPPPLSYLVSRTPHERSPQRHTSSPSKSSLVVPPLPHPRSMSAPSSGYPPLPPSAGSMSSFPIPSSPSTGTSQPRYSPRNSVASGDERRFSQLNGNEGMQQPVTVISEDGVYGIQDRSVNTTYGRQNAAPFSSHDPYGNEWGMSQPRISAPTSRPMSILSTDKELPPLPGGARPPVPQAARSFPVLRPNTSYEFLDYHPPIAPFKSEARRQSFSGKISSLFGGSRSRQRSDAGLVPPPRFGTIGGVEVDYGGFGYHFDEFGASAPSLGRWTARTDDGQFEIPVTTYSLTASKKEKRSSRTRSRGFSGRLSAIFSGGSRSSGGDTSYGREGGRRSTEREDQLRHTAVNGNGLAPSDGERYARQAIYPSHGGRQTSRSEVELRQSVSSLATFPRNSTASSRRYEAVIPQERDFIAMRYPTESERLNLMRQS